MWTACIIRCALRISNLLVMSASDYCVCWAHTYYWLALNLVMIYLLRAWNYCVSNRCTVLTVYSPALLSLSSTKIYCLKFDSSCSSAPPPLNFKCFVILINSNIIFWFCYSLLPRINVAKNRDLSKNVYLKFFFWLFWDSCFFRWRLKKGFHVP